LVKKWECFGGGFDSPQNSFMAVSVPERYPTSFTLPFNIQSFKTERRVEVVSIPALFLGDL
jgi:hypothetical protein